MPALILKFFAFVVRLFVLAVFTFAFIVLFEHGPKDFLERAMTEWRLLTGGKIGTGTPAVNSMKSRA